MKHCACLAYLFIHHEGTKDTKDTKDVEERVP